eukprot:167274-Amorphochlora_amoeboformis.AAC.1
MPNMSHLALPILTICLTYIFTYILKFNCVLPTGAKKARLKKSISPGFASPKGRGGKRAGRGRGGKGRGRGRKR